MSSINILNQKVNVNTKRKEAALSRHSFRIVCNSLIKLLEEGLKNYELNRLEQAYINFMTLINIFSETLPHLNDFNKNLPEYNILKNELAESIDTIEKIKIELCNREKTLQEQNATTPNSISNFGYSGSVSPVKSPKFRTKKTINSERVFKYILRIIEKKERNPPQILLIDIRSTNNYENGHITWKNNKFDYNGVINIPFDSFNEINVDINKILQEAEKKEFDEKKKYLIKNIYNSDLVIYYDEQSNTINDKVYQVISDALFYNNNSSTKIKRPPVMLENGYQGWIQFIKESELNLSEFIEKVEL